MKNRLQILSMFGSEPLQKVELANSRELLYQTKTYKQNAYKSRDSTLSKIQIKRENMN